MSSGRIGFPRQGWKFVIGYFFRIGNLILIPIPLSDGSSVFGGAPSPNNNDSKKIPSLIQATRYSISTTGKRPVLQLAAHDEGVFRRVGIVVGAFSQDAKGSAFIKTDGVQVGYADLQKAHFTASLSTLLA
jgi:hypothetical protein